MKAIIRNINELSDSKEMYESKPPFFLGVFISIVTGIVVVAIIWMYYGEIDIVSRGRGTIRPNDQLSIIRNKAGGVVNSCNLQEGRYVKEGDILLTIDCAEQEVKKLQLQDIINDQEKTLGHLRCLKESIKQHSNNFNGNGDEVYVQRFIQYKQELENLEKSQLIDNQSEKIELEKINMNKESYQKEISQAEEEIAGLETFKESIQRDKSLFKDSITIYAIEFETYL